MKVAVTGSTGFVGRHVLGELLRRGGLQVTAVSRSGTIPEAFSGRVGNVVMDMETVADDAFDRLGRPEVLIHLAWDGLPNYRSLHHFESHLPLQYRFLRGLVNAGLPKLVCTGTCFEYGMQSGLLAETSPAVPDNPYGFAKDALHRQLQFLQTAEDFGLTWARLFYMYGAGQATGTLYSQVQAALGRRDVSFRMSPGDQLRDYMHIDKVAHALVALALDVPAAGTINICSGRPVAVRSLVEGWIAESGHPMDVELAAYPYPSHEPLAFWGSAQKLNAVLSGPRALT